MVYVSPLKALAVDIHQNLERPLAEIEEIARELGLSVPQINVAVRTGDTPASARTMMTKKPPTFLVTTPESLYLLVTAERSRAILRSVETVIVDEIHALARDKRGSHLALTLERLDALQAGERPQRVGLSATQRPIEKTAQLLTGNDPARAATIIDCGHKRHLKLSAELPGSELDAVASTEQMGEILDRIAEHVRDHRTTLVFVNTRRLSERLAHELGERLGPDQVSAHHGSLSKERRQKVETRLRAGDLRALVATASLELGIDIGPVELVCQVGSPRSIATFLQRVGRSNHSNPEFPKASSSRSPVTNWSSAQAFWLRSEPGTWTPSNPRSPHWTSSLSRSSQRSPPPKNGRSPSSTSWSRVPPRMKTSAARTSTRLSSSHPKGSRPDADGEWPTCTVTR